MSSASNVCQGLQSCLDPLLHEPRIVPSKLDLLSPWPQIDNKTHQANTNCSSKSWNFITNNSAKLVNNPEQQVYVHPLDKRSTCPLSPKSLEMCTEGLGCETGTSIALTIDEFTSLSFQKQRCGVNNKKPKTRKVKHTSNFPPPLTSISGNEGVFVQTHREEGRLVIKAFNFTTPESCFKAERENGRLRLSLRKAEDEEHVQVDDGQQNETDDDSETESEAVSKAEAEYNNGRFEQWASSRCYGDRSGNKRMQQSLHPQYCVAIS